MEGSMKKRKGDMRKRDIMLDELLLKKSKQELAAAIEAVNSILWWNDEN
jgi:hypothetical protein